MSGYLHFTPTGVEAIDAILAAMTRAGNSFHHTGQWQDPYPTDDDPSPLERIQQAANDAAKSLAAQVEPPVGAAGEREVRTQLAKSLYEAWAAGLSQWDNDEIIQPAFYRQADAILTGWTGAGITPRTPAAAPTSPVAGAPDVDAVREACAKVADKWAQAQAKRRDVLHQHGQDVAEEIACDIRALPLATPAASPRVEPQG